MKKLRLGTIVASLVLTLTPALAFAQATCAQSKDSVIAVAKAYTMYDEEVGRLATKIRSASGGELLSTLQAMVEATKKLREATASYSNDYCERAQKTVNVLFATLIATNDGNERVRYMLTTQRIARSLGVSLAESQVAMIDEAIKPAIEKSLRALDDAIAKKDPEGINEAHAVLGQYKNTELGRSMGIPEKLDIAEKEYAAIEKVARANKGDTAGLLANARTKLAQGQYRDAFGLLERAESMSREPTGEMQALRKEIVDKWVAEAFAKAEKAMREAHASVTDRSIVKASGALENACFLADQLAVPKHDRCKALD